MKLLIYSTNYTGYAQAQSVCHQLFCRRVAMHLAAKVLTWCVWRFLQRRWRTIRRQTRRAKIPKTRERSGRVWIC